MDENNGAKHWGFTFLKAELILPQIEVTDYINISIYDIPILMVRRLVSKYQKKGFHVFWSYGFLGFVLYSMQYFKEQGG